MAQIKVTPEELEEVAKNFRDVKLYLEQMHKDLYNQTEYISSKWSGATSQRFYQDFNDAKPKMFTVLTAFYDVAEELEKAAKKFRKADEEEQKAMEERINAKMWADIGGELSGAYDASRAVDGIDPSTGEKVGLFDRTVAGVMVVGSIFQVGKLGKLGKVAEVADKANEAKKAAKATENYKDHLERQDKLLTNNGAYRKARRAAGIPNSTPRKKPVQVFDGTTEHRWVEEYTNYKGKKVYIIEHREDKMGRGPHFHTANEQKGSPFEKGKYRQEDGHYPEDFEGYKK